MSDTKRSPFPRRLPSLAVCAALTVACGGDGGATEEPGGVGKRAIVILLDAARADRFSCYGYERETTPHMDRLAERGMVFRRHFANGVNTRTSMPTLLYSRYFVKPVFPFNPMVPLYSPEDLFRVLDGEAISFPAALARGGLHTAAISAHHWFLEDTEFAAEFEEFHDLAHGSEYDKEYTYPRAELVVDRVLDWLGNVEPQDDFLLYVHLMDTHFPHFLDEEAAAFFGDTSYHASRFTATGTVRDPSRPLEGRDRDYLDALYDGSLRYADEHVGRIVDHLEDRGLLDDTLIAITADHGEQLYHIADRYLHGGSWVDPLGHVPMIVSYPRVISAGQTDVLTQGVDVHPTLLAALDVDLPPDKTVVGVDMMELASGAVEREWIYMHAGARNDDYKLALDLREGETAALLLAEEWSTDDLRGEVYDLKADPLELQNLWYRRPDLVQDLVGNFVDEMRPHYRRFHEARDGNVQPKGPFAIEIRDLETDVPIPKVKKGKDIADVGEERTPDGWLKSTAWGYMWFLAREEARPLEVTARVPNGTYDVTLRVNGSCSVRLEGTDGAQRFDTEPADDVWSGRSYKIEVGRAVVRDQSFRATIFPHTEEAWFRLKLIGFRPVAGGKQISAEEEEERTEALRALGYAE